MFIKIISRNKAQLDKTLREILDIACVVCSKSIPKPEDMNQAEKLGRYWFRDRDKIHLFGIANNHWAYISEETEESLNLVFKFRYDYQRKQEEALIRLIEVFFSDEVAVYN